MCKNLCVSKISDSNDTKDMRNECTMFYCFCKSVVLSINRYSIIWRNALSRLGLYLLKKCNQ